MIRVAIIDDGVCEDKIKQQYIKHFRINKQCMITGTNYCPKTLTHGTLCALIISEMARNSHEINSIKVKAKNRNGRIESLIRAIDYCVESRIDIINLSIGSTSPDDEISLEEATKRAFGAGIVVVAAYSNDNKKTYPASFEHVIGVRHSEKARNGIYHRKNDLDSDFCTYSRISLNLEEGTITVQPANSFATSVMTALVADLLFEKKYCFDELLTKLHQLRINK